MDVSGSSSSVNHRRPSPNGWTALIAYHAVHRLCLTQWIRARHHADQRRFIAQATPAGGGPGHAPERPSPQRPVGFPWLSSCSSRRLFLFRLGGLLAHVTHRPRARRCGCHRPKTIAPSDSKSGRQSQQKDCDKVNCPPPASASTEGASQNARKVSKLPV